MHLSGIDVIGPTAGSLARLLQDRELELWEGKRLVARVEGGEVRTPQLSLARLMTLFPDD